MFEVFILITKMHDQLVKVFPTGEFHARLTQMKLNPILFKMHKLTNVNYYKKDGLNYYGFR
jgi:hypothetical protein